VIPPREIVLEDERKQPVMVRIAVIIGSTRPERFGEIPATWIADRLAARGDLDVAVVDLRDYPLPFFAEAQSPARTGRDYRTPEMARWGRTATSSSPPSTTTAIRPR
jgi:NAD(P)H-dependent FMN reductase